MKIERIRVEGGFLDGLDLDFSSGMNVLIGGRGTGKTSVIELIRFCLGVRNYTDESAVRSREHAIAVLGEDGQVSVTLTVGKNTFSVSRTAGQDDPATPDLIPPIIFSQTDIESLGLHSAGRLRLIDSFRSRRIQGDVEDEKLLASIRSLTAEMQELAKEVDGIEAQLVTRIELERQLKDAALQEQKVAAQSTTVQRRQADLQKLNQRLAALAVSSEVVSRTVATLTGFKNKLEQIVAVPPTVERWPKEAGNIDLLVPVRTTLENALKNVDSASREMESAIDQANSISSMIANEELPLENQTRELRKQIDQLKQGAGAISRAADQIREKLMQLKALMSLRDEKQERLSSVQRTRGQLLDRLDATWERRFKDRMGVVEHMNLQLNPKIRIDLFRAAQLTQYASSVSVALRGSGLRYTELSSSIAARMSPRELVEIVEKGDSESLASLLEISPDRAIKLIGHLRDHGMAEILTTHVEDNVQLELLDGVEYKHIESLSTGQRCTVVLPMILEHRDRVLVVDQPEDHLDNAFVVDTLVKAILSRGNESQLIFATHNPNIPVLGNAAQVIVMGSDGRRGFVDHRGSLDDSCVVEKIATIMEGGAESFNRRAQFYRDHLLRNG